MDENEIMVNEDDELIEEEVEEATESKGIGTGLAMLIGGGITAAVIAGGMKLRKVWDKHKPKKEATVRVKPDDYVEVDAVEEESEE